MTIALGGLAWLAGNLLWLFGEPIPVAVLWWIGFLVLTVAGERLELSRMLRLSRPARMYFVGCVALLLLGMITGVVDYTVGMRVMGAGLVMTTLWLLRYDIARRASRRADKLASSPSASYRAMFG